MARRIVTRKPKETRKRSTYPGDPLKRVMPKEGRHYEDERFTSGRRKPLPTRRRSR